MPVPIEEISKTCLGLDAQYICLPEELDIYGMTIFTDGVVEVYNPSDGLYGTKLFKPKTVLVDPKSAKKTNTGCRKNIIAHECVIGTSIDITIKYKRYLFQDTQSTASAALVNSQNQLRKRSLWNHKLSVSPRGF